MQHPSKNTFIFHYLDTFRMGFPIIIARTSILIMVTIDAIMTGWAGPDQLAYLGIGLAPVIALMVIFIGALNATVVLASQSIGAKERHKVGTIWYSAMIHSILFSIISIFLSFFITSFKAEIDLSLPTNNGITMLGKTTISLKGSSGSEILMSMFMNMDIIIYIAIPFSNLLRILSR